MHSRLYLVSTRGVQIASCSVIQTKGPAYCYFDCTCGTNRFVSSLTYCSKKVNSVTTRKIIQGKITISGINCDACAFSHFVKHSRWNKYAHYYLSIYYLILKETSILIKLHTNAKNSKTGFLHGNVSMFRVAVCRKDIKRGILFVLFNSWLMQNLLTSPTSSGFFCSLGFLARTKEKVI